MFGGIAGTGLQNSGHEVVYVKIINLSCLLFYVLAPFLTYFYGLVGLAIAMNVAWACKILSCHYFLENSPC